MKRILCPLLLAALLLSGCANTAQMAPQVSEEPRSAPAAGPTAAPAVETAAAPAPTQTEGNLSAALVESEPRPLSEDEIAGAYERAVTAYGWFVLSPLPDTGQVVMEGDTAYRRVDTRGMTELDDLRTYLGGVFSPEIIERLLDGEGEGVAYRDIDGALYVTGVGRRRDSAKGATRLQTKQLSGTEYSVNVTVEVLDSTQETVTGLECWSFPYVFTGDRWVFTDFRLIF
ncbi:hypothetical protein [Oscillibacter sp.]|uniref:hypothetical protein n=1 Tax=Oscillibacter sp. TaxID=1945593 RepID=UPI00262B7CAC|nr:hypothetical protein [Oscillibacter sp.]MDD3347225.1 hypothetical protein [Oscillibacter sp.]